MSNAAEVILVVEDDDAKRHAICRLLVNEGFNVRQAADGASALAQLGDHPDLVVLDIRLGDISGLEICRRIKDSPETAHIPVMQVSATCDEMEHRVQGLENSADAYLSDAINPQELLATVRALLRIRHAEQRAREHEERYRTLTEALPQLVWTCDREGRCDYVSTQWVNFTGRSTGEHLDWGWLDVLHPDDRAAATESWRQAVRDESEYDIEYRIRRHDGDYLWFQTRGVALRDAQGRITKWLGTCTDIDHQKQVAAERARLLASEQHAREEAETANRLKDDFLATLSHELRTPLMAILGWAELLKSGGLDAEQTEQAVETIDRNARIQSQLIDDLLDVSRIISGKLRLDVQAVDLVSVIAAAVNAVRTAADAKQINLQQQIDAQAGTVAGDPARLQQIVWNLLSNAIKFTPRGGRVSVQLVQTNSHVEIRISDTGEGIDPKFLPYVFERFRQADGSTRRAQGGLGLGLAIVRHLTELHGGSVSATSAGRDRGATFAVRLPMASVAALPAPTRDRPKQGFTKSPDPARLAVELRGVRVLVVDDERDTRAVLAKVLEGYHASVAAAANVADAIEAYRRARPDVLISDLGMPDQDGFDLIRQVREIESRRGGHVPAVALTAFARSDDRQRALRAGFEVHLSKPVSPSEVAAVVAELSGRSNADAER